MKHPDKCDCPIHIVEDTTNVKYAAYFVVVFFTLLFLFTVGCVTTGPKAERPHGQNWDKI